MDRAMSGIFSRRVSVYAQSVGAGRRRRAMQLRRVGVGLASVVLLSGTFAWMMVASAATASFREGVGGYTGAQDTFLDEAAQDTDHGTDSRVGVESSQDEQGLLRFDGIFGSGPGQIPLGATITSASLEVNVTNIGGGDVRFHRMLQAWTESSTWNTMSAGIQTDGVEAAAAPDLVFSGTGVSGAVTISGLEASLQAWSDGSPNWGWALLTDSTDGWDISVSESAENQRPRLVVEYDPPAPGLVLTATGPPSALQDASYTLTLNATGPGSDTVVEWYIDWGDGTTETVPGNPPTATHSYALPGFTRNILVAARNASGVHLASDLLVPSYLSSETVRYAADDPATSVLLETGHGLDQPYAVVVGPDGDLFVGGKQSNQVLRYDGATGAFVSEFVAGVDAFGLEFGPDGHLYVASLGTDEVLRFDGSTGASLGAFVTAGSGGIDEPIGLVFGPDGHLYVTSFADSAVYRYHGITGAFIDVFVSSGSNGLATPEDIAFGPDGHLYVSDPTNNNVQRYRSDTGASMGVFTSGSTINGATGIAFAPDDLLYAAAYWEDRVLRFDAGSGVFSDVYVSTGQGGLSGPTYHAFVPQHQVEVLPAPLIVNSTDDESDLDLIDGLCDTGQVNFEGDPECTLRAAIEQANALPNTDAIHFDIPNGDGGHTLAPFAWTMTPGSQYPYIQHPVEIDATTQPGYVSDPVIQLDGSGATGASGGLILRTDDSLIEGFIVHSFEDEGLEIDGSTGFGDDNTLRGNWVGIDASETMRGNSDVGILITVGASGNVVDGNVVGDSGSSGIQIRNAGSDSNLITSNYVGVAPDGVTAIPNDGHGIEIIDGASDNRIGLAGAGNVIGSNGRDTVSQSDGIYLGDVGTTGNVLLGNLIGVDATGTGRLGNNDDGIAVMNGADGNTIGGTGPGDGNVIGDAGGAGGAGPATNHDGIYLENVSGTVIVGNAIGTDAGGTADLGNEDSGFRAWDGVTSTLLGDLAGSGNTIANNGRSGVLIHGTATGVTVVGNSIHGNGTLGIDLADNGHSPNDDLDGDAGPNDLLNHPEIRSATESGGILTVGGTFDVPAGRYRFEFFTNASGDPSGFGEGETFVGTSVLTHTGSGPEPFGAAFPAAATSFVTATVTECDDIFCTNPGPTSEFSNWQIVRDPVVLDTVYHGTVVLPDGASSVADAIGASVDNSKAILTFGTESNDGSPDDNEVMGVFSGPGTLTFSRVGTGGDVTIHWSVAVFSSGVRVERGVAPMNGVAQVDLPIAAVDPGRSFVVTSHKVGGWEYDDKTFLQATLTNPTTVHLEFGANQDDQSVMWQVVEYSGADVQSGTLTLASGDSARTVTSIDAVDTSKAWLTYSYTSTGNTQPNIGQRLIDGFVTDPTTLLFSRSRTGSTIDIAWRLIEFTDAAEVQHAGETFAAEASRTVNITPVSVARAFAVGGYASGGSSPYSEWIPGVARFTAELTASDQLTLSRGSTASSARVGWFVMHWPGGNWTPGLRSGSRGSGRVGGHSGFLLGIGSN